MMNLNIATVVATLLLCNQALVASPLEKETRETLEGAQKALDEKDWVSAGRQLLVLYDLWATVKSTQSWKNFHAHNSHVLEKIIPQLWNDHIAVKVSSPVIQNVARMIGQSSEFVDTRDTYHYLQSRNLWNKLYISVDGELEADVASMLNARFQSDEKFGMLYADTSQSRFMGMDTWVVVRSMAMW